MASHRANPQPSVWSDDDITDEAAAIGREERWGRRKYAHHEKKSEGSMPLSPSSSAPSIYVSSGDPPVAVISSPDISAGEGFKSNGVKVNRDPSSPEPLPTSPSTPSSSSNLSPRKSKVESSSPNSVIPRMVSEYQLGQLLGQGYYGKVFSGLNVDTGDFVAIKQLDLSKISREHTLVIMQEIDLLKTFTHPHIVSYKSLLREEDSLFLVLEYIENGSLYDILKKFGVFPENLVAKYTLQILHALSYLEDQGVIHRDLKGSNILITKNGECKVSDFGVATSTSDTNQRYTVTGTPYWMAPEIIEMQGATCKSDIWSLGSVVVELLTGHPPYYHLGPMAALFKIVRDEYPPMPEGISEDLRDFLLNCFQKDPQKRPGPRVLQSHPWIVKNALGGSSGNLGSPRSDRPGRTSTVADVTLKIKEHNMTLRGKKNQNYSQMIEKEANGSSDSGDSPGSSTIFMIPNFDSDRDEFELREFVKWKENYNRENGPSLPDFRMARPASPSMPLTAVPSTNAINAPPIPLADIVFKPAAHIRVPPPSSPKHARSNSVSGPTIIKEIAEAEIEALRKLNDENVAMGLAIKNQLAALMRDHARLVELASRTQLRYEHSMDAAKAAARDASHSNMLLKRTNQVASDSVSKTLQLTQGIRLLEDHFIKDDPKEGSRKLASVIYKTKNLSVDSIVDPTISGWLHYYHAPSIKNNGSQRKPGTEKRGWVVLKDTFVFLYKSEKGSSPQEVVHLGAEFVVETLPPPAGKKKKGEAIKHFLRVGNELVLACETKEILKQWMEAFQTPVRWYESADKAQREKELEKVQQREKERERTKTIHRERTNTLLGGRPKELGVASPNFFTNPAANGTFVSSPNGSSNGNDNGHATWNPPISPNLDKRKTTKPAVAPRIGVAALASSTPVTSPLMGSLPSPRVTSPVMVSGMQPFFGVALESLVDREGGVPMSFLKMVQCLEDTALNEEGIMRISGSMLEIQAMKVALQHGEDVDFYSHDPHAVACLLKVFFRELPTPIIPKDIHTISLLLMQVPGDSISDEQRVMDLKATVLDRLPWGAHEVLRVLFGLLVKIVLNSEKNKMNLQNLITCLVPSLQCVPGLMLYAVQYFDYCFQDNWTDGGADLGRESSVSEEGSDLDLGGGGGSEVFSKKDRADLTVVSSSY